VSNLYFFEKHIARRKKLPILVCVCMRYAMGLIGPFGYLW